MGNRPREIKPRSRRWQLPQRWGRDAFAFFDPTGSGFSQRLDKATGKINDDYLYSVIIDRRRFSQINFEALETIDPIEAIEVFEMRRQMTSTGIFKSIEPFTPPPGFIEGP